MPRAEIEPSTHRFVHQQFSFRSFENTKSTTLRNFQFKYLHIIIPTNTLLLKYGIKTSDLGTFCNKERETLIRLFWNCKMTQDIWISLQYRSQSINLLDRSQAIDRLQSQPKVSGHPQKKALPRFPSFNVATMMSTFLSIFF